MGSYNGEDTGPVIGEEAEAQGDEGADCLGVQWGLVAGL